MGLIMYRLLPHFKYSWLAGAVTGGIFHVIGYTLVKIPLYGGGVAMAECFTLVAQTAAGIVLGGVAYTCLLYTSPFKTMVGRTQAAYPAMKSESPAPMAPASIPLRVPNRQTVRMIIQSPRWV